MTWEVGADGLYAYLRRTEEETVLCVLNTSDRRIAAWCACRRHWRGCKTVCDRLSGKRLGAGRKA